MDLHYISVAVVALLGLAVLPFAWNRSLRKRVEARTLHLKAEVAALASEITECRKREETALRETDTRLQLSIRASNIGLWDWSPADGRVYFSPEYKRQLGYGDDELAGRYKEWESRLHPDDRERALARLGACLEDAGLDYENEFRLRHKDGSYRWIYARGEILRDAEGRPYRVLGCHVDVTERKHAEAALAAERNRFKSLVEDMPDEVFCLDASGRYTLANPAWLAGTGLRSESDVLGKSVYDVFPPDIAKRADADNRRIAETGVGVYDQSARVRRHDTRRWVLISKAPLFDSDGRYAGLIGVRRDVTRLKEATDELARERNLLRSIIDHAPDTIYVKDLELKYVLMNGEGVRARGADRMEDVIGRTVHDFLATREGDVSEEEDREVMRSGVPINNLQRRSFVNPDEQRWISVSKVPLREPEGAVSGVLAIIRDVTPLKRGADELARERNLLRSIIDHAPEGIYVKDVEGRYLAINPESLRRLGASRIEEVVGRTVGEFLPADAAGRIEREDRAVMQSGRPLIGERRPISSIGSERWASISKVPLRDGEGKVTGLLTLSHDITDLQRAMEQVRSLNVELEGRVRLRTAELEEANRELETFSYSVSHDLRSPLRRVNGFLQILRKAAHDRLSDEEHATMQRIAVSVQRMDQLIEDMLYLSRVAGQEIRVAEVDLSALAEQVAADLRGPEPEHEVKVVVSPGIRARADPRLMRIVLENLIGNARKFTGRAAAPRIEFGLDTNGGEPAYYVRDNGAGFDMDHAGRLFGAFQRLHHADEFPGTGIGLATVARIVRRHGGRVWADARPGAGATFYFTLAS